MVRRNGNLIELQSVRGFVTIKRTHLPPKKTGAGCGSLYGDTIDTFIESDFSVAKIQIVGKTGKAIYSGLKSWTETDAHKAKAQAVRVRQRATDNGDIDIYLERA
jgi:hypothetical protein